MKKRLTDLECAQRVRDYWNLVDQTAQFRLGISWRGARDLFAGRGYDPFRVIQLTCDQGDDVHCSFVLGDGSAVSCDLREDPETRQATAFQSWETIECSMEDEDDFGLALQICDDPDLRASFDLAVQAFFDFHLRDRDRPLPPSSSLR